MQYLAPDALARARRVRLVIFDVDGVLTDGKLWYGPGGEELKAFHAFDGHGVHLLGMARLDTAIISGRRSQAVEERAKQLGIKHVVQGADRVTVRGGPDKDHDVAWIYTRSAKHRAGCRHASKRHCPHSSKNVRESSLLRRQIN